MNQAFGVSQQDEAGVSSSLQDVEVLHAKAQLHFRKKLEMAKKRMPCISFSIFDFYFDRKASYLKIVPPDLQLDYYFANYNNLLDSGFTAQRDRDINVVRAIWYYNVDSKHLFARHFQEIRFNIILMSFLWAGRILESGTIDGICDDECGTFWYTYICAWMESLENPTQFMKRDAFIHVWMKSKYDLIMFPRSYIQRMKPLVYKIKNMVTSTTFPATEFMARCEDGSISEEIFVKEGFMLALKWALAKEGEAIPEKPEMAADPSAFENLPPVRRRYTPQDVAVADTPLTESKQRSLSDVPWDSYRVKALLEDIADFQPGTGIEKGGRVPWMDMDKAEELLKMVTVDDITRMCETMGVGGYDEDSMDTT